MVKIVENEKGFKVIAIDRQTLVDKLGSFGVCDSCNTPSHIGYWVAVLNCWLCPDCYQDWYNGATNYPEDRAIETKYYTRMIQILES